MWPNMRGQGSAATEQHLADLWQVPGADCGAASQPAAPAPGLPPAAPRPAAGAGRASDRPHLEWLQRCCCLPALWKLCQLQLSKLHAGLLSLYLAASCQSCQQLGTRAPRYLSAVHSALSWQQQGNGALGCLKAVQRALPVQLQGAGYPSVTQSALPRQQEWSAAPGCLPAAPPGLPEGLQGFALSPASPWS